MKSIKAIIFDFDGVFVNRFTLSSGELFCSRFSVDPEALKAFSSQAAVGLDHGTKKEIDFFSAIIAEFALDVSPKELQEFFHEADERFLVRDEKMFALLKHLNESYLTAVLSNVSRELAARLEGKGLYENFQKRFLSFEMGCAKPEREIFMRTLTSLDLKPDEVLFVDDSQTNINGALECGLLAFRHVDAEKTTEWVHSMLQDDES
jgi:putative hydrolase of the HAD superfamily